MIRNYLIIALRNFWRHKIFSIINILGLAIGISAALVIYLIVQYEFSYEKWQPGGERIYRVVTNMHFPEMDFKNGGVPGPLPDAVRADIPGIEESSAFYTGRIENTTIPVNGTEGKKFKRQPDIVFADNHFFNLFKYKWLAGSPQTALSDPHKVVLTESRARIYWPGIDPTNTIGQTLIYDDSVKAVVTGIVKDLDVVTHFTFKEFISLSTFVESMKANNGYGEWGSVGSSSQFFVKFKNVVDPRKIDKQLAAVRKKHNKGNEYLSTDHYLQPMYDMHFNQDFDVFDQRQAHKPTLYGLLAVAAFLLLLGCINFINLTTAQASQRAKEIGIRKTMGSSKGHLIIQFLSETLLLTLAATVLSILLTPWILNIFSDYVPEGLHFDIANRPDIIIFIALLVVAVSLLSGFYPALVLTKFKPVTVLKNVAFSNSGTSRRVWIRKTLTVSQFVIAQFFIIATMVVGKQIRFTLNKDLGFRKEAIINFDAPINYQQLDNKQFVLLDKLNKIPGIQKISLADDAPASNSLSVSTMKIKKDGKEIETSLEIKNLDTNYISLYNIKLIAGRNLMQSDTTKEYLVNVAYTKFLGYKDPSEIIGNGFLRGDGKIFPIVGVLADINSRSIHELIKPAAFRSQARTHNTFHIALPPKGENTDAWKSTIAKIEKEWKTVYPDEQFNYRFFDESIAKLYKKEQDIARLLNWSTALSILISCLGLLGLVIYTTTQRTKEIGVRKVLGASVAQIVSLISKDFLSLVIIAFVIAAPIAWWAMNNWLQDFAYRTTISWWIFFLSGTIMILIALLILSIQTIRSAMVNPVKSLRTE